MDENYLGREQAEVKHKVLGNYLYPFAYIIGSRYPSITYIDGFSGPWGSKAKDLVDTSFSSALEQLKSARHRLHKEKGKHFQIRCVFVEQDAAAYAELSQFCSQAQTSDIELLALNLDFVKAVPQILKFLQQSPGTFAFSFIDPKGWKPIPLKTLEPILQFQPGEVLINFMTSFVRRFWEHPSVVKLFGDVEYQVG